MKKGRLQLLIVLFICCVYLSGCSGKNKSSENKNQTTIKFATFYSDKQQGEIYKDIAKEYEKVKPNIKVEVVTDYSDDQKIKESLSQKNDIDIIGLKRNQVIEFAKLGQINDITSLVDENMLNKKLYPISLAYGKYNGKIYGIGDMPMTIEWFYNVDIFDRYKIQEPKNFEELMKACKKLKSKGISPITVGGMDGWTLMTLFSTISTQTCGANDFTANYSSGYNEYKGINGVETAFNIYGKMAESCISKGNLDINYRKSIDEFVKGKAAIFPAGSWAMDLIDESKPSGFNYSIFKDGIKFVEAPVSLYAGTGVEVLCIPSKSMHSKDAEDFLKYFTSEEVQKKLVEKGYISPLSSVNNDSNIVKKQVLAHLETMDDNSIMLLENMEPKMADVFSKILQDVLAGRISSSKAWDKVLSLYFNK